MDGASQAAEKRSCIFGISAVHGGQMRVAQSKAISPGPPPPSPGAPRAPASPAAGEAKIVSTALS